MIEIAALILRVLGISCIFFAAYFLFANIILTTILFLSTGVWLIYEGDNIKHRRLRPLSTMALGSIALSWLLSSMLSLMFYWPDLRSILFAWNHYLGPVTFALFVATVPLFRSVGFCSYKVIGRLYSQAFAFVAIVFLHFNFKLWAQLINPLRWDGVYQNIDHLFFPVMVILENLRAAFALLPDLLRHPYHEVFVGMFIVSFSVHALKGHREILLRLVTTVATVLILGGLSYSIAPAWGPFIFAPGPDSVTSEIQSEMASFQHEFNRSDGAKYDPSKFIGALAAMPSLHLAHSFVFFLFGLRYARPLGFIYAPCCVFLAAEAVIGKWHYLIDLPAGIAIAFVSLKVSNWLHSKQFFAEVQKS